jgi:hypothetical protein
MKKHHPHKRSLSLEERRQIKEPWWRKGLKKHSGPRNN